mgnify:CR=1 FL=1
MTTVAATRSKTYDLVYIAVFAVVMAVCSWISIPAQVPFTLQTFGVFMAVGVLGGKRGSLAVLVYILLGVIGVPVFAGFSGGLGILLNNTGGYIIGFLFTAVFLAYFRGEKYSFKRYALLGCVIGIPLIYVFGVVQLKLITGMGWDKAIMTGALPFIPLDIVKCLAAAVIAGPINRIFANNR